MTFRKKRFMPYPSQARYLMLVLVAMLTPMLLVGFCFYTLVFDLLARQLVFPEAIHSTLIPVMDRVNDLLGLTLPVLVLVIFWWALVVTHRFAGPIERLERDLDQMLAGDIHMKIHLRKKDDLKGVADRINALVKRLT